MDQLDWNHLRSFVAVAEEGHITRAAERLNTQQPPLSLRIKALEKRLGVQLFRRKARGVELTDAGRVLLTHARTLLDQHTRTLDAVQRAGRGELGRLCIGIPPTGPLHPLVPSSVRQFRERYPAASVALEECLSDEFDAASVRRAARRRLHAVDAARGCRPRGGNLADRIHGSRTS